MIRFRQKGDFSNTIRYLEKTRTIKKEILDQYGRSVVVALSSATPIDSGLTASSWEYEIEQTNSGITISFLNSNINNGVPIAIILQYGHATNNGGWVEGKEYINPAIQPIFEELANKAWKEVSKA